MSTKRQAPIINVNHEALAGIVQRNWCAANRHCVHLTCGECILNAPVEEFIEWLDERINNGATDEDKKP